MTVKLFGIIRLTIFFLLFFSNPSHAVPPGDIFNLVPGTTRGGCDDHLQNIDHWLDESITLGTAGLEGIQVARGTRAVENNGFNNKLMTEDLVYAFFRLDSSSPPADWNLVQNAFSAVLNWLNRKAIDPGNKKPWLFCGTQYLTRQETSDIAFDTTGNHLEGNPTVQDEYADKLAGGKVPWWSEKNHHYYFGGESDDMACENDPWLAAAADTSDPPPFLIFLCADNLDDAETMGTQATLGAVPPIEGKSLYKVRPSSITVFHELFHLILGNDNTHDAAYSPEGIRNAVKNPDTIPEKRSIETNARVLAKADPNTAQETNLQMLRNNPETYALFAVAYWHWTQTYPTGPDGRDQKAFFPADVAQMIDWDANVV